jgi:ATP-dependent RNA helicase DeaD
MKTEKKIEKLLQSALNDELNDYVQLYRILKKKLPFFSGTKSLCAALLKEYLGEISSLDLQIGNIMSKPTSTGKPLFEDVKDGKVRLFMNIGKSHRVSPGDLIREIVRKTGIDGKQIGKIDIHSTYTFIEIPEQSAEHVLVSLDKTKIKGVPIVVEPAKKRKNDAK